MGCPGWNARAIRPVARMSEATSGVQRAARDNPDVAYVHPGYGRPALVRNLTHHGPAHSRRDRHRLHLRRRHLDPGGLPGHRPDRNIVEGSRKNGGRDDRAQEAADRFCFHVHISPSGPVPWIHEAPDGWKGRRAPAPNWPGPPQLTTVLTATPLLIGNGTSP